MQEINNQKRMLYEKSMTMDGVFTEWDRYFQNIEQMFEFGTLVNIITSLLFIDLKFTYSLEWFELPLMIEIPVEFPPTINFTGYKKAIYDVSRYDESYYDPPQVVKAIKQLATYLVHESFNYPKGRIEYPSIARGLDTFESIMLNYAWRVPLLMELILNNHVAGFVIAGVSRVSPTAKATCYRYVNVTHTNVDLKVHTTAVSNIFESAHAPIAGLTPAGIGRAVPKYPRNYKPMFKESLAWFIRDHVRWQIGNFLMNWHGRRRMIDAQEKLETYGDKMGLAYMVHNIAYNIVSKIVTDPMKINAYTRFAIEYVFGRVKKHRPSKAGFRYLDPTSYENYLITKWKNAGLDEALLRRLIELLRPIATSYRSTATMF